VEGLLIRSDELTISPKANAFVLNRVETAKINEYVSFGNFMAIENECSGHRLAKLK
jgi:hypothetical protein